MIRVDITRGVVAGLVAGFMLVAALGYLALGDQDVAASEVAAPTPGIEGSSIAPRRYYLTAYNRPGNDVTAVCDVGH